MNDRQRLEAIVSVVCKYLPPDGIGLEQAMNEIISLVDPLPPVPTAQPHDCTRSHPHEEMSKECELRTEIARLTNCLKRANAQAEHFEREWYLRGDEIERLTAQPKEPEQEPVAWVYPEGLEALKAGKPWTSYGTRQEPNNTALYLSPQPDIPPYAWVTFTPYGDEDDVWYENPEGQLLEGWTYKPLYDTTPPQRTWVGLTPQERDEINEQVYGAVPHHVAFHAAIEAKLKEKNA